MLQQNKRSPLFWGKVTVPLLLITGLVAIGTGAGATAKAPSRSAHASVVSHSALSDPTKALCLKGHSYRIGYDVFSDSQPFAVSVSNSLKAAAKKVGCASVVTTVDNENGPTAVANVKTLINEKINGFVDFQVLQAFQPEISKLLKAAKVPSVTVVGATLPGYPQVGFNAFADEKLAGEDLGKAALKKFPGQVPYFVGGAVDNAGEALFARYQGMVAGIKAIYPSIPADHIIKVITEGISTTANTNTLSALSAVPSGSVVLVQGSNDEDTGAMFAAAQTRGFTNVLAESFGGDSYGLSQVCANPTGYAGAFDNNPGIWGYVLLSLDMMEINGKKVPHNTYIPGLQVTSTNKLAGCK
jgi:ABC-type sugar transport system substrate-binding protein